MRGHLWEIACRGGVMLLNNEPRRDLEVERIAEANRAARKRWEHDHDALRSAMEGSPYGPQYTAARLKMDAWEHEHGIRWKGAAEAPASPAIEYHVHLIWVVLILLILPLAWLVAHRPDGRQTVHRRLVLTARVGLVGLLALLFAIVTRSFRHPIAVYVFYGEHSYLVLVSKGNVKLGRPPATDATKLAAAMRRASGFRNADLMWELIPPSIYPTRGVASGFPSPPGPMISCEIRPDVAYAALDETADVPETICACLRALHDPNRYQPAHIILTRLRFFKFRPGLPPGARLGNIRFSGSQVNGLQLQLTPEQMATTREMRFTPQIAPDQQGKLELQWHQMHDRFTRAVPLWPAAVALALFPIRWSYVAGRQHRRRVSNQCLTCGYSLIANISGICPECGAACKAANPAGVSPAAGD